MRAGTIRIRHTTGTGNCVPLIGTSDIMHLIYRLCQCHWGNFILRVSLTFYQHLQSVISNSFLQFSQCFWSSVTFLIQITFITIFRKTPLRELFPCFKWISFGTRLLNYLCWGLQLIPNVFNTHLVNSLKAQYTSLGIKTHQNRCHHLGIKYHLFLYSDTKWVC